VYIAVPLLEPGRRAKKHARLGSKGGSGRWSHWADIGWVHYPEIGRSHSGEIRWVQSLEILHSIDVFLERRPNLAALGRAMIAGVILQRDSYTLSGNWYDYLWQQLSRDAPTIDACPSMNKC
jgi:hypothetical protein